LKHEVLAFARCNVFSSIVLRASADNSAHRKLGWRLRNREGDMGFGLRPWHVLPFLHKVCGPSLKRLRILAEAISRQPRARYRLLIVIAAVLVSVYAFGVLAYVIATPEIGVRCVFSQTVNHFYSEFLDPPDQEPMREGDTVVAVAGHPVKDWSQFMRKLTHLLGDPAEPADAAMLQKAVNDKTTESSHLLIDGRHVVRVDYQRAGAERGRARVRRFARGEYRGATGRAGR